MLRQRIARLAKGMQAAVLGLGMLWANEVAAQTLVPDVHKAGINYYSDGNNGSSRAKYARLEGLVTRNSQTHESIDTVTIYFIGANDSAAERGNQSNFGSTNKSRDRWYASAEWRDLLFYRVEVRVQRWVRVGKGWAYLGAVTRQTSKFTWKERQ